MLAINSYCRDVGSTIHMAECTVFCSDTQYNTYGSMHCVCSDTQYNTFASILLCSQQIIRVIILIMHVLLNRQHNFYYFTDNKQWVLFIANWRSILLWRLQSFLIQLAPSWVKNDYPFITQQPRYMRISWSITSLIGNKENIATSFLKRS